MPMSGEPWIFDGEKDRAINDLRQTNNISIGKFVFDGVGFYFSHFEI